MNKHTLELEHQRARRAELNKREYIAITAERDALREQVKVLRDALEDAANCIDLLGKNCVDRLWDGERGNPVTAKGARAALAQVK